MDLDKNGDGRISTEEMPEGAQRMLGKADADSDGFLTRDEIEKVADTLPPLGAMGQGSNGSANARGRFGEGMGMFADGPAAMISSRTAICFSPITRAGGCWKWTRTAKS